MFIMVQCTMAGKVWGQSWGWGSHCIQTGSGEQRIDAQLMSSFIQYWIPVHGMVLPTYSGPSHLNQHNLETSSQIWPEVFLPGRFKSCQVDNSHEMGQRWQSFISSSRMSGSLNGMVPLFWTVHVPNKIIVWLYHHFRVTEVWCPGPVYLSRVTGQALLSADELC